VLIAKLTERQGTLSDVEFAARLGMPRSTWQAYRCGRVRPNQRLAVAALRAFPDMYADALSFLLSDASGKAESDSLEAMEVA
jgi:hypothetical protein